MNEMGMDGHSLPAAENRDVLILNNYFSIGCFGKGCTAYSCEEVTLQFSIFVSADKLVQPSALLC